MVGIRKRSARRLPGGTPGLADQAATSAVSGAGVNTSVSNGPLVKIQVSSAELERGQGAANRAPATNVSWACSALLASR
jgi:hypothetical protein